MVRNNLSVLLAAVTSAAVISVANLQAAAILSPIAVIDTDLGEVEPQGALENMINQSGLDKPFTSGVTDFDDYFNSPPPAFAQAAAGNNWQSETQFTLPVMGYVDFDFAAVYSIDRLAVWNISMKDIRILASATSIDTLQEVASFALPNHLNFPFSYRHDLLNLGSAQDVRYLRIHIDSVHLFSPSDTFGFAIVGEVAASAVPVSAALDGDYNANGAVDAADYVVWRKNLGTNFEMPNDTTPAGVGPEDYDEWRENFGATSGGPASATHVPEPAAYSFFLMGMCLFHARPRRKSSQGALSHGKVGYRTQQSLEAQRERQTGV